MNTGATVYAKEELPGPHTAGDTSADSDKPPKQRRVRSRRTVNKIVTQLHMVLQHAVEHHGLVANPAARVKPLRGSYDAARFDFYSPEEIRTLTAAAERGAHRDPTRPAATDSGRAARATEDRQDAAIYLTAAFSGLRRRRAARAALG